MGSGLLLFSAQSQDCILYSPPDSEVTRPVCLAFCIPKHLARYLTH